MRAILPLLLVLAPGAAGCQVAPGDGYFGGFKLKTALFVEHSSSTNLSGSSYYLFSDGELTCDGLETGLESSGIWQETAEQNGVYGTLTYELSADPDDDPWLGAYGAASVYEYNEGGTASYRTANSVWFNADDLSTTDSAGLFIEINEADGEALEGRFWHPWDDFAFNAEHCGSYGT